MAQDLLKQRRYQKVREKWNVDREKMVSSEPMWIWPILGGPILKIKLIKTISIQVTSAWVITCMYVTKNMPIQDFATG